MPDRPSIISVGGFDGVHAGHAVLIQSARALMETGALAPARVVALCMDPHPSTVLRPESAPARLSTFEQRRAWLLGCGADAVERLSPSHDLLRLEPEEFIADLVAKYRPAAFVEGADFGFGRARRGDVDLLARLGRTHGFQAHVVPPVEVVLTDHSVVTASSTLCRWLVTHGRMADAAAVLGRPYELLGTVTRGDQRGRTIGFPTANLRTECLAPADGVYSAEAVLPDGRVFPAAVNVGARPTFSGAPRTIEAHLIGAPRQDSGIAGLSEYDWRMTLRLIAWLRDSVRFESITRLTEQLARDCARTVEIVSCSGPTHIIRNHGERSPAAAGAR